MNHFQIPRNSLAWLLVAQAAVIAPHVWSFRLPVWTVLLCIGCGIWRVMVYQGRWTYPGRWARVLFVIVGFVGVGLGYRTFLGVDPWVGLAITAFVLKLLEMHTRQDAYVVIILGYFVALTEFLYHQGIPYAAYIFFVVICITAALIGLNQTQSHSRPLKTFKLAASLLLQAIPLMVVLFVLFPRLAPLWTVPIQSQTARTGVTDRMTPGNIAELTQSDDLAFRATFEGPVPPQNELYWRGLTLSYFEDGTWSQVDPRVYGPIAAGKQRPGWVDRIERLGNTVRYSIILEPTNQNWLFSLTVPEPLSMDGVAMVRDYRLVAYPDVRSRFRYKLTSDLDYVIDRRMPSRLYYDNTMLPNKGNPRARRLAEQMRATAGSHQEYINAVLRMFNEQEFIYTLKPPRLGDDTVDDFLLETRSGFCEHYAGSFTFLMRAVGIPARVVVGYQGGEYNPIADYVAVYQFDAHAWTEVWLEGEGWVRVDPTSAVAPERIRSGLESAVSGGEFLGDLTLSWLKYRQTLWITELRLQIAAISHYWDSWVVGYSPEVQVDLLTRFLGDVDQKTIGMIMTGLFFGLLGLIGIGLLRKKSIMALSAVDKEFLRFSQLLEKEGLARHVGEGPGDYGRRIAAARPDLAAAATRVSEAYVQLNYAVDDSSDVSSLKQAVRAFRLRAIASR